MSDSNSKNSQTENANQEVIGQQETGQEKIIGDSSIGKSSSLDNSDLSSSDLSDTDLDSSDNESQKPSSPPGIFSVIQSVFAAMIGIQSQDKHKQDFEQGYAGSYIVVGIIMVALFVFGLIEYVDYVLEKAGQK